MTAPTLDAPLSLFDAALEPELPSDGLTIDTPHGPVDLVAVDRALAGERLHLTYAEHKYIAALIRAHLAVYPSGRWQNRKNGA
jgi:hypothetical protein